MAAAAFKRSRYGEKFERSNILRVTPPEGECISVTSPRSGCRRFLALAPEDTGQMDRVRKRQRAPEEGVTSSGRFDAILGEDIEEIIARVGRQVFIVPRDDDARDRTATRPGRSALWVDEYSPTKFWNLVGNGKANRDLLRWLQTWKHFKDGTHTERPDVCMVLLHGPPGAGKTTLAGVLAGHFGFDAISIDASSLRTEKSLDSVLLDAMSSRSIRSFMTKPGDKKAQGPTATHNCIILDEVDGIFESGGHGSGVSSLCKLVSSAGGQARPACSSPIIAICNDLYARALRPLRKLVPCYAFRGVSKDELVQRLVEICAEEGLRPDAGIVEKVALVSNCDIRSSLNTMQFLHSPDETDRAELHGALQHVGHKDMSSSVFELWSSVFAEIRPDASRAFRGKRSPAEVEQESYNRVRSLAERTDLDFGLDGCFQNATTIMSHCDPGMEKLCSALEQHSWLDTVAWGGGSDFVGDTCKASTLVGYRLRCARMSGSYRFEMPSFGKIFAARERSQAVDLAFLDEVPCALLRRGISQRDCALDYAPAMATLLTRADLDSQGDVGHQVRREVCATMMSYGIEMAVDSAEDCPGGIGFSPNLVRRSRTEVFDGALEQRRKQPDPSRQEIVMKVLQHEFEIFKINQGPDQSGVGFPAPSSPAPDETIDPETAAKEERRGDDKFQSSLVSRFRFQEGHTNAVRRRMTMADWTPR